jgi:hypothetical protein
MSQAEESPQPSQDSAPFRFYDNRQKYLAFVNTCNEKAVIAARASQELVKIQPTPPALKIIDAGVGDGTVLSRLLRTGHRHFPTVPVLVVGKEISLEDVRLTLDKMPDRFHEHPHSVLAVTNLNYRDVPRLAPREPQATGSLEWHDIALEGTSASEFAEQIEALGPILAHGWQTRPHPETGNPRPVRPSVLVLYRADHKFLLDSVIPRPGDASRSYDFVLASQPWRAQMSAAFKAEKILAPLAQSLAPEGRLLVIQSYGEDPSLEIVQSLWPDADPFQVDRYALLDAVRAELGAAADDFDLTPPSDDEAIFRYEMHTLPSEIGDRIGTSTLFAAWNAVIYVNQIEDERLNVALQDNSYLKATERVLKRYGGLWFNDESFVISRRR